MSEYEIILELCRLLDNLKCHLKSVDYQERIGGFHHEWSWEIFTTTLKDTK